MFDNPMMMDMIKINRRKHPTVKCSQCQGSGRWESVYLDTTREAKCDKCSGTGRIPKVKEINKHANRHNQA